MFCLTFVCNFIKINHILYFSNSSVHTIPISVPNAHEFDLSNEFNLLSPLLPSAIL